MVRHACKTHDGRNLGTESCRACGTSIKLINKAIPCRKYTYILELVRYINLNPLAVLFCVTESQVGFQTPGVRLYLRLKEIQKAGPLYDAIKSDIAEHAGAAAAKIIVAAAAFEVTEIRKLVDWQG